MTEINVLLAKKKLKFSKPYKFQKPDEDQYKFNVKLAETTDNKCYWEVVAWQKKEQIGRRSEVNARMPKRHFTCRQVTVWLVHGRRVSASTWAASAYAHATLFLASMQQNIKLSTPLYPWSIWFVNQICFSTGKARHWHSTCPAMTNTLFSSQDDYKIMNHM